MLNTHSKITFFKAYRPFIIYLSITCLIGMTSTITLAQISLVCNQSLQISLTESCDAVITPSQIVKNYDPYVDYTIEVTHGDGNILPDNKVTIEHIGEQVSVFIKDHQSNISCWSNVLVESKIFPDFEGCGDLWISCHSFPDTLERMTQPEMGDGQCGTYSISYEDKIIEQQCSDDGYSHIVYRTWILENQSSYIYTCEQHIYVKRQTLEDLYFPPHFNNEDYKSISCDYDILSDGRIAYPHEMDLSENLSPSTKSFPYGTGSPGGEYCSNIKVNFHDTQYPSCGNQIKILRRWNIIDWCTGKDKVQDQVIEIVDDSGPLLVYKGHYETVDADFTDCYATIKSVPFPIDVHDCSDTEYKVAYRYNYDSGQHSEDIIKGVSKNEDGSYRIIEIPSDTITLIYIVTDDCGHSSRKEVNFKLKDTKPPVAVCQARSVVTLVEGGYVVLAADKLQHHSFDNCGIVKQLIKRANTSCASHEEDLKFGTEITFCCMDSGDVNHEVSLRLFDKHGNYADCQTEIVVQDKIKPVITKCAPHQSIHCLEDYTNIDAMGGEPETYDNCHMTMSYEDDSSNLNSCGFGKMYRTWKASDDHGNWSNCIQEISIINEFVTTNHDIVWPRPKTLTECVDDDYSPSRLGEPHIPYQNCANFTFNYEDQFFYDGLEECMKILRHWTVIDWCRYDPGAEHSEGYWSQTQSIRISDSTKPVFQTTCDDIVVEANETDCEVLVDLEVNAVDDCTLHELNYSYTINYENGEQKMDIGSSAAVLFSPGEHSVLFQVTDGCGNTDHCEIQVTVKENNNLHLICLQKLSISLGTSGETEIWASDFVKDANTPCDQGNAYNYSFTDDMTSLSLSFSCLDFINTDGKNLIKPLTVYGVDENRYSGSCTVEVTVTDNFNLCQDENTSSAIISGKLFLDNQIPVTNKMVFLEDMSVSSMRQNVTSDEGEYTFKQVDQSHDYKLAFESSGNAARGISTLDLIAIQNHILSTDLLRSPYKIIAADVDNSSSVSVADLIYLRKLILGLESEFPDKHVWRFLNADHLFMDDTQPWDYSQDHYIREPSDENNNVDFIAIKIGDVNSSFTQSETRNSLQTIINVLAEDTQNGINYRLQNSKKLLISGCQLSLMYNDQELTLHSIVDNRGNEISHDNYIDSRGIIKISWNNNIPVNSHLGFLTLQFKRKKAALNNSVLHKLNLNQDFINQLYSTEMKVTDIMDLTLNDDSGMSISNAYPNPFNTETTISFITSKPTQLIVSVCTANGEVLVSNEFKSKGGIENLVLDLNEIKQNGILYCKIESENHRDIKKIIKLEN